MISLSESHRDRWHRCFGGAALVIGLAAGVHQAVLAQSEPTQSESGGTTRAPAAPDVVPEPEVVAVMMGAWEATIPADYGGITGWRLELRPNGEFFMVVNDAGGGTESRRGSYEINAQTVRLFFPTAADETDPNSTALNLADARSLETYFYRLLGPDRLAFRPTLCRTDPCQWIAERAE